MTDDMFARADLVQTREARVSMLPIQYLASPNNGGEGWFIGREYLLDHGIDPDSPPAPWEQATRTLGGANVDGWIAEEVAFYVLRTALLWEVRQDRGFNPRWPRREYEDAALFAANNGTRAYGRFIGLVYVPELERIATVTATGYASDAHEYILGFRGRAGTSVLQRLAQFATRLRRAAGVDGVVPREMFLVPMAVGTSEKAGQGSNQSAVRLPVFAAESDTITEELCRSLVVRDHARLWTTDGQFARILEETEEAWEKKLGLSGDGVEDEAEAVTEDLEERLRRAGAWYAKKTMAEADKQGALDDMDREHVLDALEGAGFTRSLDEARTLAQRVIGQAATGERHALLALAAFLFDSERTGALVEEVWPTDG